MGVKSHKLLITAQEAEYFPTEPQYCLSATHYHCICFVFLYCQQYYIKMSSVHYVNTFNEPSEAFT